MGSAGFLLRDDDGGLLLLFDPIVPPSEIVELAATRETAIVLTSVPGFRLSPV